MPKRTVVATFLGLVVAATTGLALRPAVAAVGCSLDNPEQDIAGFFPEMVSFETHYVSFAAQDPDAHPRMAERLGTPLDALYETLDVPYTLYTVDGPRGRIGYVFGANQRGRYSNIQVIAVTNADLSLREIYIQRIRSPAWADFQSERFRRALAAIPLGRFPGFAPCYRDGRCDSVPVADPTGGEHVEDYRNILRALAKLQVLSELLLRPGAARAPKTLQATAEWIGTVGGRPLSGKTLDGVPPMDRVLAPDAEVVVVPALGEVGPVAVPVSALEEWPVVSLPGAAVVATRRRGAPTVLLTGADRFVASDRVLFGTRVVVDSATGTVWSALTGAALYGDRAGEQAAFVPGIRITTWGEARAADPTLKVVAPPQRP